MDTDKIDVYDHFLLGCQQDGINVYKAHTGQKYYFGDTSIEILYTAQLLYPTQVTDGGNSLSIVSRVHWDGTGKYNYSALFMGDATQTVVKLLNSTYGKAMATGDFVQIAHHGNLDSYANKNAQDLKTFLETNVGAERYLIPTGVRHGEIVQALRKAKYESEDRLVGSIFSNNPITKANLASGKTVCVAGSSVWEFTMNCVENDTLDITEVVTAGANYYSTNPDLASTTPEIKPSGSSAIYIRNVTGLMTMERDVNYALASDIRVEVIPGLTEFPLHRGVYHAKFNGRDKKIIIAAKNGMLDFNFTANTGLIFKTLGETVYTYTNKDGETGKSKIASAWVNSLGTITDVWQKEGWLKNLTVECPNINLTGSTSGQFGILAGTSSGYMALENVAIHSGTLTKNTSNPANIGSFYGKLLHGVKMVDCSFEGSIVTATDDGRIGGLIGMIS